MSIRVRSAKLGEVRPADLAIRFAFGAAISVVAGLVGRWVDPTAGGLFLAFPAILPATLTLIQKRESKRKAEDDDSGAVLGAVALVPFAAVTYALLVSQSGVVTLAAATLAWLVAAVALYFLVYGAHDRRC